MPTEISCPACRNLLQIPDTALGKRGKCPLCQHIWVIPALTKKAEPFKTSCAACRNSLSVPAEAVGKRAKCPVCGHVWVISAVDTAVATKNQPAGWFDELMDDVHPAALPHSSTSGTDATLSGDACKLWRDGKFLVVDIKYSDFPAYCVKTGKPASTKHYIDLAWVDCSKTWGASVWRVFGPAGRYIAMQQIEDMKTKFSLRVGLSQNWLDKRKVKRWIAYVVIVFGILIGIYGEWNRHHNVPPPGQERPKVSIGLIVGCIIFAAGWVEAESLNNRSVLGVHVMDEGYAWLVGVHRDFLERLEPWNQEMDS